MNGSTSKNPGLETGQGWTLAAGNFEGGFWVGWRIILGVWRPRTGFPGSSVHPWPVPRLGALIHGHVYF